MKKTFLPLLSFALMGAVMVGCVKTNESDSMEELRSSIAQINRSKALLNESEVLINQGIAAIKNATADNIKAQTERIRLESELIKEENQFKKDSLKLKLQELTAATEQSVLAIENEILKLKIERESLLQKLKLAEVVLDPAVRKAYNDLLAAYDSVLADATKSQEMILTLERKNIKLLNGSEDLDAYFATLKQEKLDAIDVAKANLVAFEDLLAIEDLQSAMAKFKEYGDQILALQKEMLPANIALHEANDVYLPLQKKWDDAYAKKPETDPTKIGKLGDMKVRLELLTKSTTGLIATAEGAETSAKAVYESWVAVASNESLNIIKTQWADYHKAITVDNADLLKAYKAALVKYENGLIQVGYWDKFAKLGNMFAELVKDYQKALTSTEVAGNYYMAANKLDQTKVGSFIVLAKEVLAMRLAHDGGVAIDPAALAAFAGGNFGGFVGIGSHKTYQQYLQAALNNIVGSYNLALAQLFNLPFATYTEGYPNNVDYNNNIGGQNVNWFSLYFDPTYDPEFVDGDEINVVTQAAANNVALPNGTYAATYVDAGVEKVVPTTGIQATKWVGYVGVYVATPIAIENTFEWHPGDPAPVVAGTNAQPVYDAWKALMDNEAVKRAVISMNLNITDEYLSQVYGLYSQAPINFVYGGNNPVTGEWMKLIDTFFTVKNTAGADVKWRFDTMTVEEIMSWYVDPKPTEKFVIKFNQSNDFNFDLAEEGTTYAEMVAGYKKAYDAAVTKTADLKAEAAKWTAKIAEIEASAEYKELTAAVKTANDAVTAAKKVVTDITAKIAVIEGCMKAYADAFNGSAYGTQLTQIVAMIAAMKDALSTEDQAKLNATFVELINAFVNGDATEFMKDKFLANIADAKKVLELTIANAEKDLKDLQVNWDSSIESGDTGVAVRWAVEHNQRLIDNEQAYAKELQGKLVVIKKEIDNLYQVMINQLSR